MRVIEFTECEEPLFVRLTCHMGEAYGQAA